MTEPRLCKDCRWATNPAAGLRELRSYDWVCGHPTATTLPPPDYVLGRVGMPRQDYCSWVRGDPQRCGPEGRFWEAIETGFGER